MGITAAVTAVTAAYGAIEGNQQRQEARGAANDASRMRVREDRAAQMAQRRVEMTATRDASLRYAALRRGEVSAAAGYSGTLLTSPLGIPNAGAAPGRSILGG